MHKDETSDPVAGVAVEELGEGSIISDDDATLIALGKKPELRRVHSFWSRMNLQDSQSVCKADVQ
jgi:hypothetical protein